ncbi:MAG: hypothetical protein K2J83_00115 [Clostridia bacterium]|nr:hypothetical protein [Clostridia bacterium]
MMKSKGFYVKLSALIIAVALMFSITAIPVTAASANSAPENWYGTTASGAMVTGENCPVVVESEVLTFDIQAFPNYYYYTQDELDGYKAKVTAHYNFYNPESYDVDMTLVFPFGNFPSYVSDDLKDVGKYEVTADGEKVESTIRHTFCYGTFNAETDVAKISDDFKEDGFYSPDTPVHYYTLKFSGLDGEYNLYLKSGYDSSKTAIFYGEMGTSFNEAPYALYKYDAYGIYPVSNGSIFYFFVVGDDFEGEPRFSLGSRWSLFEKTNGDISISKEEITFKDLMLAFYEDGYGVSEVDWYNAALEYLSDYNYLHYTLYNSLMRWYEYKLTIPARTRLVNEVTAPIYPDIDTYYSSDLYGYTYLLSPAKGWASFGNLEIVINTPYYLTGNSVGNFERVEGGYRLFRSGLPDGELDFTLCAEQNPVRVGGISFDALQIIFIIFACVEFGLQIIAAIVLIIVFAVTGQFSSKSKNKKL